MSFGRHRQTTQPEEKKPVVKVEQKKEVVKQPVEEKKKITDPLEGTTQIGVKSEPKNLVGDFLPRSRGKIKEVPEPSKKDLEIESIAVDNNTEAIKVIAEHIREEIKPLVKPQKKKRVDKKEFNNIGLIGDTIVSRDFRAIVKKKGEQINTVLTKILHDWNAANYNL